MLPGVWKLMFMTLMSSSRSVIGFIRRVALNFDGRPTGYSDLFLYFLSRNKLMFRKDGSKRIADHTLVALTVMIAESRPEEKEMMVNLVMTFLK